jgi:cytidylate kinase
LGAFLFLQYNSAFERSEKSEMVITIDGPGGSGKSTVARKLANKLGFIHLNSGALFRAVAFIADQRGVALDDAQALSELALSLRFGFRLHQGGSTTFLVDDVDLGQELSTEEVGEKASRVARLPELRQILLELQQEVGRQSSLVVEGRDSGTVVFPNADKKFYLDANLDVRAMRKLAELVSQVRHVADSAASTVPAAVSVGEPTDGNAEDNVDWRKLGYENKEAAFSALRKKIEDRDRQDATREFAPHRKADEAITIDTSTLTPEEVVEKIVAELALK